MTSLESVFIVRYNAFGLGRSFGSIVHFFLSLFESTVVAFLSPDDFFSFNS